MPRCRDAETLDSTLASASLSWQYSNACSIRGYDAIDQVEDELTGLDSIECSPSRKLIDGIAAIASLISGVA
jgi:hypothetical protein